MLRSIHTGGTIKKVQLAAIEFNRKALLSIIDADEAVASTAADLTRLSQQHKREQHQQHERLADDDAVQPDFAAVASFAEQHGGSGPMGGAACSMLPVAAQGQRLKRKAAEALIQADEDAIMTMQP